MIALLYNIFVYYRQLSFTAIYFVIVSQMCSNRSYNILSEASTDFPWQAVTSYQRSCMENVESSKEYICLDGHSSFASTCPLCVAHVFDCVFALWAVVAHGSAHALPMPMHTGHWCYPLRQTYGAGPASLWTKHLQMAGIQYSWRGEKLTQSD